MEEHYYQVASPTTYSVERSRYRTLPSD